MYVQFISCVDWVLGTQFLTMYFSDISVCRVIIQFSALDFNICEGVCKKYKVDVWCDSMLHKYYLFKKHHKYYLV